jgi:subtilisin-like proprotein convertase family protein
MKTLSRYLLSYLLLLTPMLSLNSAPQPRQSTSPNNLQDEKTPEPRLSEAAAQQMDALLQEKKNRTPEQRKIDPQLLYEAKKQSGQPVAENVPTLSTNIQVDDQNRVLVEIRCQVTDTVVRAINRLKGEIEISLPQEKTLRARLPLTALESLASLAEIRYIEPAEQYVLEGNERKAATTTTALPFPLGPVTPLLLPGDPLLVKLQAQLSGQKRANVRQQLAAALPLVSAAKVAPAVQSNVIVTGPPFSQGDAAHRSNVVRDTFGADGAGIKIGVLSDTPRYLEQSQANGNLPRDVTIVPGQSGATATAPGVGEGTAMMEIIHDVAPGAKLFYATALGGQANFANNIRRLRFEYGCDIIVDDIFYFAEPAFQDGIVARAVNDVVANGGMYFSSAGNAGNLNDGTSGVWEGDFKDGGQLATLPEASSYKVHDFGNGVISNRIRALGSPIMLNWADPQGASDNDYDVFVLDANLSVVRAASTRDQTGTQDPYEQATGTASGDRIVIAKYGNAEPRALQLSISRGQLALATDGQTRGHAAAAGGYGVAAVPASVALGGAFIGGPSNPVETFTSDGPRRIFFNADGSPITPGNYLFASDGGTVRLKPDVTAADGVSTSVPGFTTFFGTSAAAPHAAAVAALLKSAAPQMNAAQMRELLTKTALDIGPAGWDRSAGAGIVMPLPAYLIAKPSPFLDFVSYEVSPAEGDGDRFIEPGENGNIQIALVNNGTADATGIKVRLTSTTPGVTILNGEADFWPVVAGKGTVNLSQLRFRLNDNAACGLVVNFVATISNGQTLPRSFAFSLQTGQPSTTPRVFSYTGPPVAIPDGNSTGIRINVPVSGLTGNISKVVLRIDGDDCARPDGTGLQHSYVSDLAMALVSPRGTGVILMNLPGGIANEGQNFCNTVFDDDARNSIQSITGAGAPYTGSFKPASPLTAFNGQSANGTWVLQVADFFTPDAGTLRKFSLLIYTYDCQKATAVQEVKVEVK